MYPTSNDWLACLGMCPVFVIPSARVSFMPRDKLEKALLKQELLFISDQHSKFFASLTCLQSQSLDQLCFTKHPSTKDYYVFIFNSRTACDVSQFIELTYMAQRLVTALYHVYSSMEKNTLWPSLLGRKKGDGK